MEQATPLLTEASITANGIGKRFGTRRLWTGLSFVAHPGEMVALSGPSGSGKTTLLNCIGLLDTLTEGTLHLGRQDISRLNQRQKRRIFRHQTGFLFQNYGLVDSWTVDQNLDIALAYSQLRGREKTNKKLAALDRVGLGSRRNERVFTLSGGEQQRTALARLLLKQPKLILADEPTGSLDRDNADTVIGILSECAEAGALVLISTHDPRVVEQCDRTIFLG
ncbi:ATP-binding cassette domain-containing protein [Arthrobacter sp. 2RAF6]|uniref:ATP-binding cassette domain-containing protein n=1 Tax=Arthrobacter sp. 2RAF6 TaxID=3233002 RepID=UPI003F8EDB49